VSRLDQPPSSSRWGVRTGLVAHVQSGSEERGKCGHGPTGCREPLPHLRPPHRRNTPPFSPSPRRSQRSVPRRRPTVNRVCPGITRVSFLVARGVADSWCCGDRLGARVTACRRDAARSEPLGGRDLRRLTVARTIFPSARAYGDCDFVPFPLPPGNPTELPDGAQAMPQACAGNESLPSPNLVRAVSASGHDRSHSQQPSPGPPACRWCRRPRPVG
jgi:hypothetical protein